MRRSSSRRRFNWLSALPALAIVASGCGEQQLPEAKIPGGSREIMENPLGYADKVKGAEAKAADAKSSAKIRAHENAAKSDPRGH